jgi:hypothetical protein
MTLVKGEELMAQHRGRRDLFRSCTIAGLEAHGTMGGGHRRVRMRVTYAGLYRRLDRGAAELLGLRPTTLSSKIATLENRSRFEKRPIDERGGRNREEHGVGPRRVWLHAFRSGSGAKPMDGGDRAPLMELTGLQSSPLCQGSAPYVD